MLHVLSSADVEGILELEGLLETVERGLIAQYRGTVERPERPHYPIGHGIDGDTPLGTGLVMPAYVHGAAYAVTKLVGVFEGNEDRALPTINALLVLTDARTGVPRGVMDGTLVTNARTGCIGGVAVRALTTGSVTLGVLGAGAQARWQTRAIGAARPVDQVRIYSPSDSKYECAEDLRAEGFDAEAVESSATAVHDASVVVTATTSESPVFPASALRDGAVVVAIGAFTESMQELEAAVVDEAVAVYADVPSEAANTGDIVHSSLVEVDLIELGRLLAKEVSPPEFEDGHVVVESVGSAVLDAVAAERLYDRVVERDRGTTVPV